MDGQGGCTDVQSRGAEAPAGEALGWLGLYSGGSAILGKGFKLYVEDNPTEILSSFAPGHFTVFVFFPPFTGMDDKNAAKLNELIQVG